MRSAILGNDLKSYVKHNNAFIFSVKKLQNIVWSLLEKIAVMAESQTFYRAFAPAMDVLQHKGWIIPGKLNLCIDIDQYFISV